MYKQFVKYAVIGIMSILIDFVVYLFLTRKIFFFHSRLIEAKAISFFLSSIFNFNFNKKWTFGRQSRYNLREVAKYYSVALTALAINALLMSAFLKIFMDLIAWLFAAVITALINFTLSRLWVFKPNKET
ncbi:MAG: GtrA family protein [Candidatus Berkelbacteria bacterium]|nr:GtrA family protein [Candidatus Berkelbacteria bacterium]